MIECDTFAIATRVYGFSIEKIFFCVSVPKQLSITFHCYTYRYRYRSVTPLYYTQYSTVCRNTTVVWYCVQSPTCTVAHCNILLYNVGTRVTVPVWSLFKEPTPCTTQYMYTAVPTLSNFLLGEERHRSARKRFFNCEKKYSVWIHGGDCNK